MIAKFRRDGFCTSYLSFCGIQCNRRNLTEIYVAIIAENPLYLLGRHFEDMRTVEVRIVR